MGPGAGGGGNSTLIRRVCANGVCSGVGKPKILELPLLP